MRLAAIILPVFPLHVASFSAKTSTAAPAVKPTNAAGLTAPNAAMFEYLKWGGSTPNFDVLGKTVEYVDNFAGSGPSEDYYDENYVLRGGVIGPLTRKDLRETQEGFSLKIAFPDITIQSFGFAVDPENPYRCFWFQRWRATHSGVLKLGSGEEIQPTMNAMEPPVWVNSVVWTPEQKIIYEQVGATVDRLEGNTKGKAAVFGLLHTAGADIPASPGDSKLRILQRVGHFLNFGRSWSREEDVPKWWTSKSRGGDPSD